MDIDEMKWHVSKIEEKRSELAKERDALLSEIRKYEAQQKYSEQIVAEGKCYKVTTPLKSCKDVIALKILKVLSPPNHDYARCLVVSEKTISNEVISLWLPDVLTRTSIFRMSKMSHLEEIPSAEFDSLLQNQLAVISTFSRDSLI